MSDVDLAMHPTVLVSSGVSAVMCLLLNAHSFVEQTVWCLDALGFWLSLVVWVESPDRVALLLQVYMAALPESSWGFRQQCPVVV